MEEDQKEEKDPYDTNIMKMQLLYDFSEEKFVNYLHQEKCRSSSII